VEGHGDVAYSCACSPDGTRLVSTSGDMTVRVWLVPAVTQSPAVIVDHLRQYVNEQRLAAVMSARELAAANTRTEVVNTRKRQLEGDPEALQGCTVEELRQVVADIERAGPRARDALTRAEASATAAAAAVAAAESAENATICGICMTRPMDTALNCWYVQCHTCLSNSLSQPEFSVTCVCGRSHAAGTCCVAAALPTRGFARCARLPSPRAVASA